jgi:dihydroorotase
VTAEVTPHHLLLTEQLVAEYDTTFKVNPPLRKESDVLALREALIDGTIDIIATDHAPHAAELKDCEWSAAAFGMVGLETAASVAQLVLIESNRSTWQRLADVLSHAPARIARDENHGQKLVVGSAANLTLVNAAAKRQIVAQSASKSSNNPYSGLSLPGSVVHTIFRGRFTVKNSALQSGVSK